MAGAAAELSVATIAVAVFVFLAWPPPSTIENWFLLFQRNGFLGMLELSMLLVTSHVVLVPVYLALHVGLQHASQSFMAIALACNLPGRRSFSP